MYLCMYNLIFWIKFLKNNLEIYWSISLLKKILSNYYYMNMSFGLNLAVLSKLFAELVISGWLIFHHEIPMYIYNVDTVFSFILPVFWYHILSWQAHILQVIFLVKCYISIKSNILESGYAYRLLSYCLGIQHTCAHITELLFLLLVTSRYC